MVQEDPMQHDGAKAAAKPVLQAKKKQRTLGTFPCPACSKTFKRSDHLSRHYLNHDPKEVFECDYLVDETDGSQRKCGRTFVRKDLKERHMKRHIDEAGIKKRRVDASDSPAPSMHSVVPIQPLTHQPSMAFQNQHQHQQLLQHPALTQQLHPDTREYAPYEYAMPPTQNDILSWLFIDSPPNGLPPNQKYRDFRAQPMSGIPGQSQGHSHLVQPPSLLSQTTHTGQTPLNVVPTPLNVVPTPPHIQNILAATPVFQMAPDQPPMFQPQVLLPMFQDESLTPLYNTQFSNTNLFSNNDNPLDEVFLKSLPENSAFMPNNVFFGTNGSVLPGGPTPGSTFNFIPSTASSSSPATTADSTPAHTGSTNGIHHPHLNIGDVVNNHAKKYNSPKFKHLYIDTMVLELCISSVDIPREKVELVLHGSFKGQVASCLLKDRFSYYLSLYWKVFHPQFSFIHKPSFDTTSCPPLLLLLMIMLGSNYADFQIVESKKKSPEFKFSVLIATPLRFMIFQDEDFRSPVKLWVLQALNILEWCEKNFLTRDLHERAHIHHGTTAQLLRRSPLLGGNPTNRTKKRASSGTGSTATSAGEDESDSQQEVVVKKDDSDYDVFMKWVEAELMKRITFMTFLVDIMDYVKFRHNPQIMFYQLQLLHLPCDDDNLWNSTEVLGTFKKVVKRQKKLQQQQQQQQQQLGANSNHKAGSIRHGENFLSALKKLIRYNGSNEKPKNSLSVFTKKILFGGLLLIMYQMQQADIQNNTSSLLSKSTYGGSPNLIWKESLTKAFDRWNIDFGSCTENHSNRQIERKPNSPSMLSLGVHNENHDNGSNYLKNSSLVCQFAIYHLTQIIGMSDLNQYDIAVFGGSPANMSVDATMKDHVIVQTKLNNMWSKYSQQPGKKKNISELINLKSVIHSYLILWELMLKPQTRPPTPTENSFCDWHATPDYFDSMYAVGVATLTLWSFAFTTSGLESTDKYEESLINNENYEELVQRSKETGHAYLYRVREEFTNLLSKETGEFSLMNSIHPYNIPRGNSAGTGNLAHDLLCKYAELLPKITNKQHISGLCFLVGTKLMCSQWEILRENARLILNCGLRSIGKKTIICQNLFSIEWSD